MNPSISAHRVSKTSNVVDGTNVTNTGYGGLGSLDRLRLAWQRHALRLHQGNSGEDWRL
jgi:hypothetical protein